MVFLPGWWTPVSQLSIFNLTYSCKTTSYSWLKSYCCNQRISKCATLILKLTSLCFQFKLLLPVHVKLLLGERSCCLACKKAYWWRNLLATKARRFSIQHCVPLCDQIHDSDGQHHLPNDSRIPILFTWDWCLSVCDWGLTRLARVRRRPHTAAAKVSTLTLQNVGECYNGYVQFIRISLIRSRTYNSFKERHRQHKEDGEVSCSSVSQINGVKYCKCHLLPSLR